MEPGAETTAASATVVQPTEQQVASTEPAIQAPPQPSGSEAEQLASLASSLGDFISDKTRAELLASSKPAGTASTENTNHPAEGDKPAPAATDKPAADASKKDAETAKPDAGKEGDTGYKSKFFKQSPDKKGAQPAAIVIETPDHIVDVVKGKFGMDVKSINELPKFFETAQNWRKDAEQYKKVSDDHKKLTESIQGLPQEFFDAFELIGKGEDWRKAFEQKSKIDFNIPADKQDKKALVNHFYPGKFTDDDFADSENEQLKAYTETALDKFQLAKERYESERARRADEGVKHANAYKSSVEGSVKVLKQDFPDTDEDIVKEISSVLEGGPQSVMSFFFENGMPKPDAAMRLMMAKYGKEEIEGMMSVASKRAESQIHEEILTRGADTPKPVQRVAPGNDNGLSEVEKKKLEDLKELKTGSKQTF